MRRPILQWPKIHAGDRPAKMHQNAFIFVVPGVALLTPWTQKLLKIVENSSQNDHKKCDTRSCNGQKRRSSNDLQKYIKTRSYVSFPVLLCSRHESENHSKSSNIIDGSTVVPAARRANSKCIGRKKKTIDVNETSMIRTHDSVEPTVRTRVLSSRSMNAHDP